MEEFTKAVEEGMRLSRRVCYSNDLVNPPKPPIGMNKSTKLSYLPEELRPNSPMLYSVIYDPSIVDNPDYASYQPHVYGRMNPPALIPLQMNEIGLDIQCCLDSALVTLTGSWRVHCVMGSRSCDCRIVIPMGEQGSLLGVEADVSKQSYSTQIVNIESEQSLEKTNKEYGCFLKPHTFSLIIPKVSGGSMISLKVSWVQNMLYKDGEFTIKIPFKFPEFVNPVKNVARKEKIKLCLNTGTAMEVICKATSHALKETSRQSGSLFFSYDAKLLKWSSRDFHFSYTVCSGSIFGSVMLQSPMLNDLDQREVFYISLFPGNNNEAKVFRNKVVFVVDTSKSMQGMTLESTTDALSTTISKFSSEDSFSIIAFNDKMSIFSSSLKIATTKTIKDATQWLNQNLVAGGGTNIMQPLNKALDMLLDDTDRVPHIFLITDGSVEDERSICSSMKISIANRGAIAPRIHTLGLGLYCNHYFLRTLATISRGQYDAAFDSGNVESRIQSLVDRALSPLLVNMTIDSSDHLDNILELYPLPIPDLLHGSPLIIVGRCQGNFSDSIKVKGILPDLSNFAIEVKVQRAKHIPIDRISARQQFDMLTVQAWFSNSKQLEEKVPVKPGFMFVPYKNLDVINLSKLRNLTCEYCDMVLYQIKEMNLASEHEGKKNKLLIRSSKGPELVLPVQGLKIGFGNIIATTQNLPTFSGQAKPPENTIIFQKTINCCSGFTDCFCCYCCIRMCSCINDQCAIAMTQLCAYMTCLACFGCCSDV